MSINQISILLHYPFQLSYLQNFNDGPFYVCFQTGYVVEMKKKIEFIIRIFGSNFNFSSLRSQPPRNLVSSSIK